MYQQVIIPEEKIVEIKDFCWAVAYYPLGDDKIQTHFLTQVTEINSVLYRCAYLSEIDKWVISKMGTFEEYVYLVNPPIKEPELK